MLTIPLAEIGEDGVEVDETVQVSAIQPEGATSVPVAEVQLTGVVEDVGGIICFGGRCLARSKATAIAASCRRQFRLRWR